VTSYGPGLDPFIAQTPGHYRLVEKIGSGGIGEVYRAQDEHLDREVAIKLLRPQTSLDEHARKLLRKEAAALSKLNHSNIATIHDFDTQQGLDFLVMEYVRGKTLLQHIGASELSEKEVAEVGMQIAQTSHGRRRKGAVEA
jgi:serine/threonine protein kinase